MSKSSGFSARRTRFLNRLYARLSARQKAAEGFVSAPEPRAIGSFARGRQLVAGNLLFSGFLIESRDADLWAITAPGAAFEAEIHGFGWLDDLAAVGDAPARECAQRWLWGWIDRHGDGQGPGWTPDLTGRRVIRWINHALFVLRGVKDPRHATFYRALAGQTWFLSKRWRSAPPGLARFEALTGLIYAGLSLQGKEALAEPALRALARECRTQIDACGGLPTRNPEELLEVFTLLTWAAAAMVASGQRPLPDIAAAIDRIAPTLRTLRHADGGLPRFHGGGRGLDGRLDQALVASTARARHADGMAMGFMRLSAARTSVLIDASAPPSGNASYDAHASTLAFELTSGRRPVVVNCGSGRMFGPEWRRAGRATPSHSVLCLDGYSSARLAEAAPGTLREALVDAPSHVPVAADPAASGLRFEGAHNGYVATHGVTHARVLDLAPDGRSITGEDMLLALENADKRRFDRVLDADGLRGIGFEIRFHLHPDADAALDMGGAAVSIALKSGEIWVFRYEGGADLTLEPGVYLQSGRLKPRATKQVVLTGRAMEYATRVRWSVSKARETAVAVRDFAHDESYLTE
ncbi:MAG: heparinase II/III family protein [Rhodobacteraceae bacterium]|nr:heparinase II/III family protein [Paracoccaceae bacterium]